MQSAVATLRPATNADIAPLQELVFAVLHEYGLQPDPQGTDRDLANIEAHYFERGGWFGVLEAAGSVVASVGLDRHDATTCELRKMYCASHWRGRGLGRQLLDAALLQARHLGFKRVVLETASPLKEAIALYRRYGFTPYTPAQLAARCDQAYELWL